VKDPVKPIPKKYSRDLDKLIKYLIINFLLFNSKIDNYLIKYHIKECQSKVFLSKNLLLIQWDNLFNLEEKWTLIRFQ